jgi:hypothetical protein
MLPGCCACAAAGAFDDGPADAGDAGLLAEMGRAMRSVAKRPGCCRCVFEHYDALVRGGDRAHDEHAHDERAHYGCPYMAAWRVSGGLLLVMPPVEGDRAIVLDLTSGGGSGSGGGGSAVHAVAWTAEQLAQHAVRPAASCIYAAMDDAGRFNTRYALLMVGELILGLSSMFTDPPGEPRDPADVTEREAARALVQLRDRVPLLIKFHHMVHLAPQAIQLMYDVLGKKSYK